MLLKRTLFPLLDYRLLEDRRNHSLMKAPEPEKTQKLSVPKGLLVPAVHLYDAPGKGGQLAGALDVQKALSAVAFF